jgi:hypothetical protein
MTEIRFPDTGLTADFGDIILGDVADYIILKIKDEDSNVLIEEKYVADSYGVVTIRRSGSFADNFVSENSFSTGNSVESQIVNLTFEVYASGSTVVAISKTISFYPCTVDFSGTLNVALLKTIPLSRATEKYTVPGRKECISFYAFGGVVKLYVVRVVDGVDTGSEIDFYTLPENGRIAVLDVSPEVIAASIGCNVSDLIYYNLYQNANSIIRYYMDDRQLEDGKTFIFRNCFNAPETITLPNAESSTRKWTRTFGQYNEKQVPISRDLENKLQVKSDFLSSDDIEVLEDLCNSKQVCLIDSQGFQDVVILEETFQVTDSPDELNQAEITYRFAQNNQFKTTYKPFRKPRIFSTEFDETFN